MSIVRAQLKYYRSTVVSDASSNGGRMSATEEASLLSNSLWQDAGVSELTAGSTKYRKGFHKVASTENLTFYNTRYCLERPTSSDDRLFLFLGTQTNTQNDLTGSEALYGAGKLDANASSGATSITVLVEHGATVIFRNTELLRISDKENIDSVTGNQEFIRISGTPSVSGNVVTIGLATALVYDYDASDTYVSSVIENSDVKTAMSNKVVTSASGTFDLNQVVGNNIGGIQQTVTLTFSSASAFSASSDVVGSLGSGNISTTFAPTNSSFSTSYFSIPAAAYGGTFTAGDTVAFTSAPAATPIWEKRIIPAGAASHVTQSRIILIFGESA